MKKILLKKLKISHFKGLKSFEGEFADHTDILGDNEKGKTTLYDAFLWLLFGKDSTGRKEFEIKPIGGSSKNVEVEGTIEVGGKLVLLKRTLREKWTKRRGSAEARLTGHETVCHIDDVPVTVREYNDKIDDICEEEVFKMVTSPGYFTRLHWKDQRTALFDIANTPGLDDIAGGDKDLLWILAELKGRDMDDYKKIVLGRKKKIREEIEWIPARIDEVERSLPEAEDFAVVSKELDHQQKELAQVEGELEDHTKSLEKEHNKRQKVQAQIYEAKNKLQAMAEEAESQNRRADQEASVAKQQVRGVELEVEATETAIAHTQEAINNIEKRIKDLRQAWHQESARQFGFDPEMGECPTCGRPLDPGDLQEKEYKMRAAFNNEKAHNLAQIQSQGVHLATEKKDFVAILQEKEKRLKELRGTVQKKTAPPPARVKPESMPGYNETLNLIADLEEQYQAPAEPASVKDLKERRSALQEQIAQLRLRLEKREQIKRGRQRIAELENQQQALAQDQASLEKQEHLLARLETARVEAVEKEVNSMFEITRWKLFERQLNGEDIPVCEATYKDVPYSDMNNAARINTGIDIANTLAGYYEVSAPIWIDNAEAVVELHKPTGQLIRLVVEENKPLTIINHERGKKQQTSQAG